MEVVEAIIKLNKIFKEKNWVEKDTDEYVFDSFCKLFENFDDVERSLIIELTERYAWISYNEYQSGILQAMNLVDGDELNTVRRIYFFPIIKPHDEGAIKSGPALIYMIKSIQRLLENYRHIEFVILSKFDQISAANFSMTNSDRLFLIDDYVGSGETVNDCLAEIGKNITLNINQFKIVCIACQEETLNNLTVRGIPTYVSYIGRKGITDYNTSPELEAKKQLMLEIERSIPGGTHFSLGYNQTEALITMMRTPDNTFPIFWKKHRRNAKYFNAPFARGEII